MAEQELETISLREDFTRDGRHKVVLAILIVLGALALLVTVSFYLHATKPDPVSFPTDNEWRAMAPIPVDQPYLSSANLLQWVSEVIPKVFTYDFVKYQQQYTNAAQYFTNDGYQKYSDLVKTFVNFDTLLRDKVFVSAVPTSAPFIVNQGLISGRYAWWVQLTMDLNYVTVDKMSYDNVKVQALVTRISTLDNLEGISIDNLVITKI